MAGKQVIGVCGTMLFQEPQQLYLTALCEAAAKRNVRLMIFSAFTEFFFMDPEDRGAEKLFEQIPYHRLDGMVLFSESIKSQPLRQRILDGCLAAKVPVIVIEPQEGEEEYHGIKVDYEAGFEQLVRHITDHHGCRTMNLLAGIRGNSFSERRVEIFCRVLREHGIEPDPRRIDYGDFWQGPTEAAMERFLTSGLPMPEALICCNDTMAITACEVLERHGIRVPEDMLVTGFDGIFEERFHTPRLTTAAREMDHVGNLILDLLKTAKTHPIGARPLRAMISCRLMISESCGCVKVDPSTRNRSLLDYLQALRFEDGFEEFLHSVTPRLTEAGSLWETGEAIWQGLPEHSWLCVNEHFGEYNAAEGSLSDQENDSLEQNMRVVVHRRKNDADFSGQVFPTAQLLPNLEETLRTYQSITVVPLYFRDHIFGYLAAASPGLPMYQYLYRFLRYMNNIAEFIRNQAKIRAANQELERLYLRDPMVDIFNRRGFFQMLSRQLRTCTEPEDTHLVVICTDMDGLKFINDEFGHQEGDAAIQALGDALKACCTDGQICSRFGGDEFVTAFLTKGDPKAEGEALLEQIRRRLADFNQTGNKPYPVEISCGMHSAAVLPDLDVSAMLDLADELMYAEKSTHKRRRRR